MNSKLKSLSDFVTAHPFITIGIILVVDGWVSNLLSNVGRKSKKKDVIDGEFEEVKS